MAWEKSSAELVELFRKVAPAGAAIEHKKMFGYLCAFVNGNLFAGLFQQSMIFRLSAADRAAFLDQPGTADFEPMPGHKLKSYALLREPLAAGEDVLGDWMKCSLEFASGLPKKKTAAKKKRAR